MTGHRDYLDVAAPRADRTRVPGSVNMIHIRNDELIERVLRAKHRGVQDDVRVA